MKGRDPLQEYDVPSSCRGSGYPGVPSLFSEKRPLCAPIIPHARSCEATAGEPEWRMVSDPSSSSTLSEDEKNQILLVTDLKKLDAAVNAFVFAEDKESVLKLL